jgi:hypothetical protein
MSLLTEHNLHSIEDMIRAGKSAYFIAKKLGRNVTVITRLLSQYPRETFVATEVILSRQKVRSSCSKAHQRIAL